MIKISPRMHAGVNCVLVLKQHVYASLVKGHAF